jgi:hypothetical protein
MYKFSDNDINHFSLHDCRATKLTIGDHSLTFEFEDGYYLCGGTMLNQYTGRSEVSFTTPSDKPDWNISIYVFEYLDTDEDSEESRAIRTSIPVDKFIELLNNGAQLEFLDEYSGYEKFFYDCVLWYPKGVVPRTMDCQIFIRAKDITYRWNEVKTEG